MKIINVVGARPNFMKIAPIVDEMRKYPEIEQLLVHTGQHYDEKMSKLFFDDLELPKPDIYLGIGSGSHAEQTAKVLTEFENILLKEKPDLILVVGDVNSTIACALASVKLGIPVAHVEAGLRSFDRTMPEEINRILTDAISDYLFITEKSAEINLLKEGRPKEIIHFVGNVMIDTLIKNKEKARQSQIITSLGLESNKYALLTLHRPGNVDNKETFEGILEAIGEIQKQIKVVCPVHPRTRKRIEEFNSEKQFQFLKNENFVMVDPIGYLDFLKLMSEAKLVLTDSGGIQEETTVLGVPCITLRENTERPVTIDEGTNTLVGTSKEGIIKAAFEAIAASRRSISIPEKWDGYAAKRIVDILINR